MRGLQRDYYCDWVRATDALIAVRRSIILQQDTHGFARFDLIADWLFGGKLGKG